MVTARDAVDWTAVGDVTVQLLSDYLQVDTTNPPGNEQAGVDWLAAHREHPLDTVYTMALVNTPAFILGFPLETLAGLIAFRGMWAIFIHSNVRLPIGPLRMLIGAPELHHWHHDRDRDAGNYANISPLMDILFGTYVCPDHEPESFGLREPISQNYLSQLWHPFRQKPKA